MANLGLMMGLGAGMQTAGEGWSQWVNQRFIADMERRKQQSLAELENRRLDIMESGQKADTEYKNRMASSSEGTAFDVAREGFYERLDKKAQALVSQLPDSVQGDKVGAILKDLLRNEDLMYEFMQDGEIDSEKLNTYLTSMAAAMPGSALSSSEAKSAVGAFAKSMAKEWKNITKRFPDYAYELSPADIVDQLPSLYGANPFSAEMPAYDPAGDTPPPLMPAGGGQVDPAATGPSTMDRFTERGGLMNGGLTGLGQDIMAGVREHGPLHRFGRWAGDQFEKLGPVIYGGDADTWQQNSPYYGEQMRQQGVVIDPNLKDDYNLR